MDQLNPQQREAVRYVDGPLLVLAGAGSGKTRVIAHKIAYLVERCGLKAGHVAAVTFTNRAAREMRQRVAALLPGRRSHGLRVSTFHTLGLTVLRAAPEAAGLRRGFTVLDDRDTLDLVRDLAGPGAEGRAGEVLGRISAWKNALVEPAAALAAAADDDEALVAGLYGDYQRSLRAYNGVDFDDLIGLPARLFRDHPEVLADWQGRIRYLLVDEYQDTNAAQYHLVRLLMGIRGALTVVGDDDQSIYAWRGARPENLAELQRDFPSLKVIKLEQNYRSSGRILKAANAVIAHNPHLFSKSLWSALGYGDPIRVLQARDENHEAHWVVSEIVSHRARSGGAWRDYAILYRGNHQARLFERVLREQQVPYFLSGGTSFFARSEIRDLMGYLRLLVNPDDDAAFLRVVNTPRRGIGATTLEALGGYAAQRRVSLYSACFELGLAERLGERGAARLQRFCRLLEEHGGRAAGGDPGAAVADLLGAIGYRGWIEEQAGDPRLAERRLQNVAEFQEWFQRLARENRDGDLAAVVAHLTLVDILERQDEENDQDRVNLLTLHGAKGLEFPHVFLVGMEEDLLPHHASTGDEGLHEERRLCYVGITRARRSLTLCLAGRRRRFGEMESREPSRFLAELPAADLEWLGGNQAPADPEVRQARGRAHLAGLRGMLEG